MKSFKSRKDLYRIFDSTIAKSFVTGFCGLDLENVITIYDMMGVNTNYLPNQMTAAMDVKSESVWKPKSKDFAQSMKALSKDQEEILFSEKALRYI